MIITLSTGAWNFCHKNTKIIANCTPTVRCKFNLKIKVILRGRKIKKVTLYGAKDRGRGRTQVPTKRDPFWNKKFTCLGKMIQSMAGWHEQIQPCRRRCPRNLFLSIVGRPCHQSVKATRCSGLRQYQGPVQVPWSAPLSKASSPTGMTWRRPGTTAPTTSPPSWGWAFS